MKKGERGSDRPKGGFLALENEINGGIRVMKKRQLEDEGRMEAREGKRKREAAVLDLDFLGESKAGKKEK